MTVQELTLSMEKWKNALIAFGLKLTKDHSEAVDLYQETAYRAIRNIHQFREGTNLRAWLMTIMRNIFINSFRKKRKQQTLMDGSLNQYLIDSSKHVVRNQGEEKVGLEELEGLIDRLGDHLKLPFLRAFEGYKYEEIAEEFNIPVGTVKSRVFMARKQIKKSIKRHYAIPTQEELSAA